MRPKNFKQNTVYLYLRNKTYYYRRRIPKDISYLYEKERFVVSLKTKQLRNALSIASNLTLELDIYWSSIRHKKFANMYVQNTSEANKLSGLSLSMALEYYLKYKSHKKTKLFFQSAERSIKYVIDLLGDKDLSNYSSSEAANFRDYLFQKGLVSSSVKRIFSSVKSIVNFSISEKGLDIKNPFSGIYIPSKDDTNIRQPISMDNIRKIQLACKNLDDDMRWIIALISDTGMRLSEAIGIKREDVNIDGHIPYVSIKPNNKRRLKTKHSERIIPLAGHSLWAAKRMMNLTDSEYFFSRYNQLEISNSNSASAALNKWIKTVTKDDVVVHAFRHSFRDRLRNVECPKEIIDQLGGWSKGSIGENYGSGYNLDVLSKWIRKIII